MRDLLVDTFCKAPPSAQNAADIFAGAWKSAFPVHTLIDAGDAITFDNNNVVRTVDSALGGLTGANVLEIGPFEGYYTYHLLQHDVGSITAVESNRINYLKCLVVKEILDLHAVTFLLGDFMAATFEAHYDLCFAAGVLYHQVDPLRMLSRVAAVSDSLYLWTHYWDLEICSPKKDSRFGHGDDVLVEVDGYSAYYHRRKYRIGGESRSVDYSGGVQGFSSWLARNDILDSLRHYGFSNVELLADERDEHRAGPYMSLVARR